MSNWRYISGKLVNIDNILYINTDKDMSTGEITVLFVMGVGESRVIKRVYENSEAYEQFLAEAGITVGENSGSSEEGKQQNKKLCIIELVKRFFVKAGDKKLWK